MAELKDANTNPWYVLMTLYGEQTGEEIDWDLHAKNCLVWNSWQCQFMSCDERSVFAGKHGLSVEDLVCWNDIEAEMCGLFAARIKALDGTALHKNHLPAASDPVNLQYTRFVERLVLRGYVFRTEFFAKSAIFQADVILNRCNFLRNTTFNSSVFLGLSSFEHVKFLGRAYFKDISFEGDALFASAVFRSHATFGNSEFVCDTSFEHSKFERTAQFYSVNFQSRSGFRHATFFDLADFSSTSFSKFADFSMAKFGNSAGDKWGECRFNLVRFEGPASFREAIFFSRYPNWSGSVVNEDIQFSAYSSAWPQQTAQYADDARDSCAAMRHVISKQGLPEDEHFFFRREMRFAGLIGTWWEKLPFRIFGFLSNYGHSIARPAIGLAILWITPALIYTMAFEWALISSGQRNVTLEGFGLSFANIFKFFGFQRTYFDVTEIRDLAGWLQVMGAAQTVVGFILLFFFGLGLRTRFRMR